MTEGDHGRLYYLLTMPATTEPQIRRDSAGRFQPGSPKTPGSGRRKGQHDFTTELIHSLRRVEKKHEISMFDHAWEQALTDNTVLVALLRKFIPDRHESDGSIGKVINVIYPGHWDGGHGSPVRSESRIGDALPATPDPA